MFYKEEIGYSVEVPDLKGCITQADTLEEAIEMAQDAALGWILTAIEDNEEIPKASNIENLRRATCSPQVWEALTKKIPTKNENFRFGFEPHSFLHCDFSVFHFGCLISTRERNTEKMA